MNSHFKTPSVSWIAVVLVATLTACASPPASQEVKAQVPSYILSEFKNAQLDPEPAVALQRFLVKAIEDGKPERVAVLVQDFGVRPGPGALRIASRPENADSLAVLGAVALDSNASTHGSALLERAKSARVVLDALAAWESRGAKVSAAPREAYSLRVEAEVGEWLAPKRIRGPVDDVEALDREVFEPAVAELRRLQAGELGILAKDVSFRFDDPVLDVPALMTPSGGVYALDGHFLFTKRAELNVSMRDVWVIDTPEAEGLVWAGGQTYREGAQWDEVLGMWVLPEKMQPDTFGLWFDGWQVQRGLAEVLHLPRILGAHLICMEGKWGAMTETGQRLVPPEEASREAVLRILSDSLVEEVAGQEAVRTVKSWKTINEVLATAARATLLAHLAGDEEFATTGGLRLARGILEQFGALPTILHLEMTRGGDGPDPRLAQLGWDPGAVAELSDLAHLAGKVCTSLDRGNVAEMRAAIPAFVNRVDAVRRGMDPSVGLLPGDPSQVYVARTANVPMIAYLPMIFEGPLGALRGRIGASAFGDIIAEEIESLALATQIAKAMRDPVVEERVELRWLREHYSRWGELVNLLGPLRDLDPLLSKGKFPKGWEHSVARLVFRKDDGAEFLIANKYAYNAWVVTAESYRDYIIDQLVGPPPSVLLTQYSPYLPLYRVAFESLEQALPDDDTAGFAEAVSWLEGGNFDETAEGLAARARERLRKLGPPGSDSPAQLVLRRCLEGAETRQGSGDVQVISDHENAKAALRKELANLGASEPVQELGAFFLGLQLERSDSAGWRAHLVEERERAREARAAALASLQAEYAEQADDWTDSDYDDYAPAPTSSISVYSSNSDWEAALDRSLGAMGGDLFYDYVASGGSQRYSLGYR